MTLVSVRETDTLDDAEDGAVFEAMQRARLVVPPRLHRPFTARYVTALLLVALLSIGSQVMLHQLIAGQSDAARTVNLAGRQRMLSQQIALQTTRLASGTGDDALVRARMTASIEQMRRAQRGLLQGDVGLGLPTAPPPTVASMLTGGVDARVETFLDAADEVLATPAEQLTPDTPAVLDVVAAAMGPLLPALDDVVRAFEADSEQGVSELATAETVLLAVTLLVLLTEALVVFRPMSARIHLETSRLSLASRRHRAEAVRQRFTVTLRNALDMDLHEEGMHTTLLEATRTAGLPGASELLVVTPGTERLRLAAGDPGAACTVEGAGDCPAMRRARTLVFEDSSQLGGCPHLRRDHEQPVAATCTPITFQGSALGVLRTVTAAADPLPEDGREVLETIAGMAGMHLGTARAFQRTRDDARLDSLTGLLNRRGLAERVASLDHDEMPYATVLLDLDLFKAVNDTYGHEAGDDALVEVARVLLDTVRPSDVPARLGGEEFVVVLPGEGLDGALAAAERIRVGLAKVAGQRPGRACTGSFGVTASGAGGLESALRRADGAMYLAKTSGRNQVVAADDALDDCAGAGGRAAVPEPRSVGGVVPTSAAPIAASPIAAGQT